MKFYEIIDQVSALLCNRGRLSYRAISIEFGLDETSLAALKEELIDVQELAADKDGKMLVWVGEPPVPRPPQAPILTPQPPSSYTPQHLAERIRAEHAAMESRGAANGERKTITALFADLKGSTALIEGLDPEEARTLIDPALQLMMDAVHCYDGYVAQALGDGIFALFGAPIAHEDHPQRALYAALRMQEEMREYSDQSRLKGGIPLQMRVGVNTGEVVVRSIRKDDLHTDYVPVGHSTNLAARMEQLATPGSIVVSEYTRKLVEGYFDLKALGAAEIKGVEEPLDVYEVLGAGPLRTRLQVSARRGLSRFVGRRSELEQLQHALEQAKAGHGQIVGVMGEPGLGKSRLFHEFKLTAQSGCLVLEAFSVSHGKASPYLPLIELLKTYFQIEPTDDERSRRAKVMGQVLTLDRSLEDTLPYLFALLGIEDPESSLQQMDAQIRRQRTFEALKKLFLRESLDQPLILLCEDLHWIDTETQGFLDALSESIASAPLLLLVNYRPEYRHEWGHKTYYTQLRLAPLGQAEAAELLDALLGVPVGADLGVGPPGSGAPAPLPNLKQLILAKTDGTPFFIEEVVQELVEQGRLVRTDVGAVLCDRPPPGAHVGAPLQIPATVQGVLAARIDRLAADEKALLQQLSVIGRQFPRSLVQHVILQPDADVYRLLASLQAKEFLYEQPAFPEVEYLFKHALTQEVAYGTVLHEQRKALHERTGQALEVLYADSLEDHYGALAHHYSQSDNLDKAVEYLELAGQQAAERSANAEAIHHLRTALDLLQPLPETSARTRRELTLQTVLGPILATTQSYAASEVEQVYTRAQELCQQLGETVRLFPVLSGLFGVLLARPDLPRARQLAEQLLGLAERDHTPRFLVEAHRALGVVELFLGELVLSRTHSEQAMALHDPLEHASLTALYGHDPGLICRANLSLALWLLGYPDQAVTRNQEVQQLAQELSDPYDLGIALSFSAGLHQLRGEGQLTLARADAVLSLSTTKGFALSSAWSLIFRGWALSELGQHQEGIVQLQQGLAADRATESEIQLSWYLGLLAEAYGKAGQAEAGLATVAEALAVVERTGEVFYEAELHRLKGELVLQSGVRSPESAAERYFQQAIDIARQQQAKSWELRAATSLARLWQQQGKTTEARDLLAPVYGWFTEGFDTKDLQEAQALPNGLT